MLSDVCVLSVCLTSDICLSSTSGLNREQRGLGKPKLAPTLHVTRTPLSRSKGQRSWSPGRFTHRGIYTSGSCSAERGKIFTVGTYCYVAVCRRGGRLGGARRFGAHRGRRRAGHIVAAARPQLVRLCKWSFVKLSRRRSVHSQWRDTGSDAYTRRQCRSTDGALLRIDRITDTTHRRICRKWWLNRVCESATTMTSDRDGETCPLGRAAVCPPGWSRPA